MYASTVIMYVSKNPVAENSFSYYASRWHLARLKQFVGEEFYCLRQHMICKWHVYVKGFVADDDVGGVHID